MTATVSCTLWRQAGFGFLLTSYSGDREALQVYEEMNFGCGAKYWLLALRLSHTPPRPRAQSCSFGTHAFASSRHNGSRYSTPSWAFAISADRVLLTTVCFGCVLWDWSR